MTEKFKQQRRKLGNVETVHYCGKQLAIWAAVTLLTLVSFIPYILGLDLHDEDPSTPYSGASTEPLIDIINAVVVACMCMMLLEALLDAQSLYIPIKIAFPRFVMVLGVLFASLAYYFLDPHANSLDSLNFLVCAHYAKLYVICGGISFRLLNDTFKQGRQQWFGYALIIVLYLTELQLKQWTSYYHNMNNIRLFYIFKTCVSFGTILIGLYFLYKVIELSVVVRSCNIDLGQRYYDLMSHVVLSIIVFGMNTVNICFGFQSWKNTSATEFAGYNFVGLFATVLFFFTSNYISQRHFVRAEGQLINKKSFVRYVSHEIRTPLNTVYLGIQLLAKDLSTVYSKVNDISDDETADISLIIAVCKLQDIVKDIGESCFVSIDILNDLLLIDKIEEGNLKLDLQPKNAHDIFEPCINKFDVQAQFLNVDLNVDLQAISHVTIKVDENKIVQVVRNIVSNALKFTPSGGHVDVKSYFIPFESQNLSWWASVCEYIRKRIMMSADRVSDVNINPGNQTAGKIRIEFLDTGPGISEVNKTELFESVIQFDANKLQSGGGSGLGLFISNAIMNRHLGGRIGVLSGGVSVGSRDHEDGTVRLEACETSPSGCIFYIEVDGGCTAGFPSYENVEGDKTTMICSNNDDAHHHVCQGMRDGPRLILKDVVKNAECFFTKVLVVEDSKFNQKMMSKALDKYAARIVLADDGVQAVDAVRRCVENQEQPFDLIFMDSLMPNMNGIDATAIIIKELNYQNPVIAITGNMLPEDVKAFENAGVLTVLGKPLNLDTLHDVLKVATICIVSATTDSSSTQLCDVTAIVDKK